MKLAGARRQFLQFFSDVLDEGWWNAVTHDFREFVVGQRRAVAGTPNDKFDLFDGKRRRKGANVE